MSHHLWWGWAQRPRNGRRSRLRNAFRRTLCFQPRIEPLEERALLSTTAYQVPADTVGSQEFGGPHGMDFDVNEGIVITRLGAFDSGSDGLARTIIVRLYNRVNQAELASLIFGPGDTGDLAGGSRFLALASPLVLAPGFQGSIVAEGYGPGEPMGNALFQPVTWTTDDGGGLIDFVGGGRWTSIPGFYPGVVDGGPANRYAAGTFDFLAFQDIVSGTPGATAGQAYTLNLNLTEAPSVTGWTIDWGDGSVEAVVGNPSAVTHVYAAAGSYAIAATALDSALGRIGTAYRDVVLSTGPAGYWRLDETTPGTAHDATGSNHAVYHQFTDAGLNQSGALVSDGNSSARFNGTDQYVRLPGTLFNVPADVATADFTASFAVWFRTTAGGVILGQTESGATPGNGGPSGWVNALYVGTDGRVRSSLFWHGFAPTPTSDGAYNDGQWHHAAAVYDNGVESLYVDGVLVGSTVAPVQGYAPEYAYFLGVGFTAFWPALNGGWHYFDGNLDEAAAYHTALTPQQVQAQYLAGITARPEVLAEDEVTVPVVDAGADASVGEGAAFRAAGSFTDESGSGPWSAVVDYGDGSGVQVLALDGTSFTLNQVYAVRGQYTVTVRVTNRFSQTGVDTLTLTVHNVAPSVQVTGPADGVRGQARSFLLSADDSAADRAAGFAYTIDWGDGSGRQVLRPASDNGAGQQVEHVYTRAGSFVVRVTAADRDGLVSTTATSPIEVTPWAVQLQPDPLNPGRDMRVLVIGGTKGDDLIFIDALERDRGYRIRMKEHGWLSRWREYTAAPIERVVVYGQDGDDWMQVGQRFGLTAELHGGAGNDFLTAGSNSLLMGDGGCDVLLAGKGRSVLIGGAGSDVLLGWSGENILIGDATKHDGNQGALRGILAEWSSDADRATRVGHLSGAAGGLNDAYFLDAQTLKDDLVADVVLGCAGRDWILPEKKGKSQGACFTWPCFAG